MAYWISFGASFLILMYLLPFLYGVKILLAKFSLDWKCFIRAFVSGFFIATLASIILNYGLDSLWSMVLPSHIFKNWGDALTGPLSEELIKALVALLFIFLIRAKSLDQYFIVGIGLGLGLQVMEDMTYIFPDDISDQALNQIIPVP